MPFLRSLLALYQLLNLTIRRKFEILAVEVRLILPKQNVAVPQAEVYIRVLKSPND